ncbi:MAG TPA: rhodanese-like domain-containing protein [Flavobacteriales bacterium]|nr:rhodanese-like domain-containing protein [Flavobacteriales bacterium]|tara:strand:- start:70817 stop:71194 length:378 start_codon:yes stop_codon:yes gene_type:complete
MEAAKEICPTTTYKKAFEENALLVDVREPADVEKLSFDVPNIINIPISEFETRYTEIPKDKEVVMVCKSGVSSLKATYFLMNHDYTNVYNMRDGIEKWVRKRFPVKGDVSSLENSIDCCSSPNCC